MLVSSKNVVVAGRNHLLTTGTDESTLGKSVVALLPCSIHFQCMMKLNMFKPINALPKCRVISTGG